MHQSPQLLSLRTARVGLLALAACCIGLAAQAATTPAASTSWSADPARSTLEFSFEQAGAKTTGRFAKFVANIEFSPMDLANARFDVTIEMSSVDTRDKERDTQLLAAELFDAVKLPRAQYVATQFVAKGNAFEAQGKLSLRGVTRDVPVSFTFQPAVEAGQPIAWLKGTASVKRLLFGVGQGEWKSTEWISDDVQIAFNLRLSPRAAPAAAAPAPAKASAALTKPGAPKPPATK